jgi:arylformamidase
VIDEALEAEYNIRRRHPESPEYYRRFAADSEVARQTLGARPGAAFDVAYGAGSGETLDLFPAPRSAGSAGAPVFVFIHGGYWRALDKRDFSFIAPPFVAAGISVAMVNYDLAPRVEVETIVAQTQAALGWVIANLARLGGDPARLFVGGHSAGGQLTALALLDGPKLAGGLAWSGVFDLVPLLGTNVNDAIRLDEPRARRLSPRHIDRPLGAPLLVGVGGGESRGFVDQSCDFAATRGLDARVYPGLNHYTIMLELARPGSQVHRDAVRFMTG